MFHVLWIIFAEWNIRVNAVCCFQNTKKPFFIFIKCIKSQLWIRSFNVRVCCCSMVPCIWISISIFYSTWINPLKPELNPICYLLALLGAHHFLQFSRIRVKLLTLRRLMSYIYGAPILDVFRSHTTTQHSR